MAETAIKYCNLEDTHRVADVDDPSMRRDVEPSVERFAMISEVMNERGYRLVSVLPHISSRVGGGDMGWTIGAWLFFEKDG